MGALAGALLAALAAGMIPQEAQARVMVSPSTLSVGMGETKTLAIQGATGAVSVKSSDASKIGVRLAGSAVEVTGLQAGTAKVTVKDKVSSAIASVTVTQAAGSGGAAGSGRLLASNCYQCHGTNGSGGFKPIRGEAALEIPKKMREMALSAPGNDIMKAHSQGYTDEQLKALADWLAKQ